MSTDSTPGTPAPARDVLVAAALHDPARLAAVGRSGLLVAGHDPAFDRAVRIVRRLLGVPVAHFSVVGGEEQAYPSHVGLPEPLATARRAPLAHSLCTHVVAGDAPFAVSDARADARLAGHPAVDGFGVQAYLGVPVRDAGGHVLGALCGIDLTPRAWTADDEAVLTDVAATVEAELVLRAELTRRSRSEAQYRALFEGSSDAILLLDPTTERILDANASAVALYRTDRAALMSSSAQAFSSDGTEGAAVLARLRAGGPPEQFESVHCLADGTAIDVRIRASLVRAGNRYAILSINRDVTEQRRAEAALARIRTRAARLALVADRTTNGVVVTDAHGHTEWVNAGFTRISGYTLDDLRGRCPGHVLQGPDTDRATVAALPDLIRACEPFSFEILNYTKLGAPYWISIDVSPLIEDDGTLSGYMAVETDVTERVQAEALVRASEAQYRSVVESVRDAVVQTDAAGCFTFLNPAWETITGFSIAASLGRPAAAFVHPDGLALHGEMFGRLAAGVPFVRFENRIVTRTGEVRHIEVQAQAACGKDGTVIGNTGTVSDITDTVRFAAEREARTRTEDMLRLKSAFLNNMSHELRTPLTGILGFAELLADEVSGEQLESVEIIVRSARRLQDTLNSVLDLAQIESGTVALHPTPLDVLAEAREALAVLAPLARRKGLTLDAAGVPAVAVTDRAALHRVLYNLVGNALKFTEAGSVRVSVEAAGAGVRLSVTDTGIGIDAAFVPRLFDEFTQASEGYARTHEGNGLGLSITQQLVTLMGGALRVESALGVGTTFTVELPGAAAVLA